MCEEGWQNPWLWYRPCEHSSVIRMYLEGPRLAGHTHKHTPTVPITSFYGNTPFVPSYKKRLHLSFHQICTYSKGGTFIPSSDINPDAEAQKLKFSPQM